MGKNLQVSRIMRNFVPLKKTKKLILYTVSCYWL